MSTKRSYILKQTCIWKQFKYVWPSSGHQALKGWPCVFLLLWSISPWSKTDSYFLTALYNVSKIALTLSRLVSTKRSYILKQICSFQLQIYLSMKYILSHFKLKVLFDTRAVGKRLDIIYNIHLYLSICLYLYMSRILCKMVRFKMYAEVYDLALKMLISKNLALSHHRHNCSSQWFFVRNSARRMFLLARTEWRG